MFYYLFLNFQRNLLWIIIYSHSIEQKKFLENEMCDLYLFSEVFIVIVKSEGILGSSYRLNVKSIWVEKTKKAVLITVLHLSAYFKMGKSQIELSSNQMEEAGQVKLQSV